MTIGKTKEILIGLDVGFGETKIVSSAKLGEVMVYPSFVHPTKRESSKILSLDSIKLDRLNVKIDDSYYFVGENARNIPTNVSKRTKRTDRARDEYSQVLFKTAIALGCPDESGEYSVRIVTGLPNSDYDTPILDNLKEFLEKDFEIEFVLSSTETIKKSIKIEDVEIIRQPEGSMTYSQFSFSTDPKRLLEVRPGAEEYIGLIDIGHYTTDYGLFNKGVIIQDSEVSGSTIAVDELYRQLKTGAADYFSKMNIRYSHSDSDLDDIVRTKKLRFAGNYHDMEDVFDEGVQNTAENIVKEITEAWRTEINRVGKIYLTGGGSHALSEKIGEIFENEGVQGFEIIDNPTVANALGFYMFGVIKKASQKDLSISEIREAYINPHISDEGGSIV